MLALTCNRDNNGHQRERSALGLIQSCMLGPTAYSLPHRTNTSTEAIASLAFASLNLTKSSLGYVGRYPADSNLYCPVNSTEIRRQFLEFAGRTKFRKFSQSLRRFMNEDPASVRLRFWQQDLWERFGTVCTNPPTDIHEIVDLMLWCDVHQLPLQDIPSFDLSNFRKTSRLETFCDMNCPFGFGFWKISCPECVNEIHQWILGNHDELRLLTKQTTLEKYKSDFPNKDDPAFIKAIRTGQIAIAKDMHQNDEFWEWDAGNGLTGLAIVRDGKIMSSWNAPLKS